MKRGRPKGSRNKSTIAREKLAQAAGLVPALTMEIDLLRKDLKRVTRRANQLHVENVRLRQLEKNK